MRQLDEMKLARIIDAADGIDGRVKMQKMVYLLTVMGYQLPFDDFTIRQQGPFSRAVAVPADALTGGGFVEEKQQELGKDDEGQPVIQYSYHLRPKIAQLVRRHFDIPSPPGKPRLEEIVPYLKGKDRAALEVAATHVYLQREDKLSGERLKKELHRLKGHLEWAFPKAEQILQDMKRHGWLQ